MTESTTCIQCHIYTIELLSPSAQSDRNPKHVTPVSNGEGTIGFQTCKLQSGKRGDTIKSAWLHWKSRTGRSGAWFTDLGSSWSREIRWVGALEIREVGHGRWSLMCNVWSQIRVGAREGWKSTGLAPLESCSLPSLEWIVGRIKLHKGHVKEVRPGQIRRRRYPSLSSQVCSKGW